MPRVRTTDGHLLDWDREAIAKQLLKETKLSEQFYKEPGITEEEAEDIAKEVERRVRWMNVRYLSGPLVREIMNVILLERHHTEWRNICTRVGTPVFDAHLIDIGTGFESKENANLQENAETSHKKKADKISKEQYLLLLPPIWPTATWPGICISMTWSTSGPGRSARTGICATSSITG